MRCRYAAEVEAVQFTSENHDEVTQFLREHASLEHVSYRQMGRDNPAEFDAPGGFRLSVRRDEWVLSVDRGVTVVGDDWFRRHCTPLEEAS